MNNSWGYDPEIFEGIFKHISYALSCGALMVSGAAISRFSECIMPKFPAVSFWSGFALLAVGLGLATLVGNYGIQRIYHHTSSFFRAFIFGGLYFLLVWQMAMASWYVAVNNENPNYKIECYQYNVNS